MLKCCSTIKQNNDKENDMKSRAAVAFQAGKPLEIVEVDLEGPKSGEVLIEIKATGICHTDAFTLSGDDPEGQLPPRQLEACQEGRQEEDAQEALVDFRVRRGWSRRATCRSLQS